MAADAITVDLVNWLNSHPCLHWSFHNRTGNLWSSGSIPFCQAVWITEALPSLSTLRLSELCLRILVLVVSSAVWITEALPSLSTLRLSELCLRILGACRFLRSVDYRGPFFSLDYSIDYLSSVYECVPLCTFHFPTSV